MIAIVKLLLRSVICLLVLSSIRSFSWDAMCLQVRAFIDCFIGEARIPLVIVSIRSLFKSVIGVSVGCVKGSSVKPTRKTPSRYIVASSVWSIVLSHIRFDVSPLKRGIIR